MAPDAPDARSAAQAPKTRPWSWWHGALVARRLRILTGVGEPILDNLPSERTRYTALAAVMICTASIGGFSMFFTLSEVLGHAEVWFGLIAAFWSVFILCVDCWLVSSTAGTRWRARVSVLLPRLAIAAVFGIVIAEPLVLRVFQTGIVSHVRQERQEAIDQLSTSLVACNPVPGVSASRRIPQVGCGGMILNISGPASAMLGQVQALQHQESTLQAQLNTETTQLDQLEKIVNEECNGNSGAGLTGVFGNGPACRADQHDVLNYESTHPVADQNAQLTSLQSQIKTQQGQLSDQQSEYKSEVSKAISNRMEEETPPDAPIGMSERFQALGFLSVSDPFIGVASWFIRLFFILIDCLPVLVKFISGGSPYDRLVDDEIMSAEKRFKSSCNTRNAITDADNSVTLKRAEAEAARKVEEINLNILRQDSRRDKLKEDALDQLWHRKLDARRSAGSARQFSDSPPPQMNGSS